MRKALMRSCQNRWRFAPACARGAARLDAGLCFRRERIKLRRTLHAEAIRSSSTPDKASREDVEAAYQSEILSDRVLKMWRTANAVCFDIDCTVCNGDSLDELASYLGKSEEVEFWTNKAMNGEVSLEQALEERMRIIDPSPSDIQAFLDSRQAKDRLNPGIKKLIRALRERNVAVYLISGGFREMALPVARELGIPSSNLYANRMFFTLLDDDPPNKDGDSGTETETDKSGGSLLPTKFAGFDKTEPTSRQGGKPQVIRELREKHIYENVVMVGDGITDLEAIQIDAGADCFIGYGGNVLRKEVAANADWLIRDFDQLYDLLERKKVCFIGSGAWACAAAKLAAANAKTLDLFEDAVEMWVYQEEIEGKKLTEIINETGENCKYLPNISIGKNVHAEPELLQAVKDANVLVLCCPHEFVHGLCNQLQGHVQSDAIAISLTKGMRIRPQGPQLISEMVRKKLGIDCSVLMGANIALDIGLGQLSEATIGFKVPEHADVFAKLFQSSTFNVTAVQDVEGAEMCGTLKNIVAVAAGLSDGLDYGSNTKAAIIRQGLSEIRLLSKKMFPSVRDETFLESCGVADLVASCYGGRNRRVAEAFARNKGKLSMEELAEQMLGGQKLQGKLTADEVHQVLLSNDWSKEFPLFTTVWKIVNGAAPVEDVTYFMHRQ